MPYISNKRPKPKPPQNNVMTISKALKAVNDNMDWTVLFIALLLVMVQQGTACRYPALLAVSILENPNQNNIDCHSSDLCKSLSFHSVAIAFPMKLFPSRLHHCEIFLSFHCIWLCTLRCIL